MERPEAREEDWGGPFFYLLQPLLDFDSFLNTTTLRTRIPPCEHLGDKAIQTITTYYQSSQLASGHRRTTEVDGGKDKRPKSVSVVLTTVRTWGLGYKLYRNPKKIRGSAPNLPLPH